MALHLQFAGPSQAWAELSQHEGTRLFIPTTDPFELGAQIELDVELPGRWAPLVLQAKVVALRPLAGTNPAGVYVALDAASLDKARAGLGAPRDESARLQGRTEKRVDCTLQVKLLDPATDAALVAKSLSATGLTLSGDAVLFQGSAVRVAVTLPLGTVVEVAGQVAWARTELKLWGLKLTPDDATRARLEATVAQLDRPVVAQPPARNLVVVADDEPSIIELLTRVLAPLASRVLTATRGDDALKLVREQRPDLVLLDVLMPGLDGLAVCQAMRADTALQKVPVVLLSAMGSRQLEEAVQRVGATDSLAKPLNVTDVRVLVRRLLAPAPAASP